MAIVRPYVAHGLRTLRNGSGLLVVLTFLVVGAVLGSHGIDQHSGLDDAGAGIAAHAAPGVDAGSTSTDAPNDGGPAGHGGVIGACIALAAAFVLVLLQARSRLIRLRAERGSRLSARPSLWHQWRPPDPPNLIALSISRC